MTYLRLTVRAMQGRIKHTWILKRLEKNTRMIRCMQQTNGPEIVSQEKNHDLVRGQGTDDP